MAIMLGISPKNPIVLKYLGGLHNHLRKQVMLFIPRKLDDACIQTQYLENIGQKNEKPSGSKKKEHQETSKKGRKYKNTTTTTH
jgi:hypothetical protein